MRTHKKLVIANRKMHGSLPENHHFMQQLARKTQHHQHGQYIICPPHPYLHQAQTMLKEFGCQYVIIGHSERRARGHDTDQSCGERFKAAVKAGLTPIFCIGENLKEYEEGLTDIVTVRQLNAVITQVGIACLSQGIIAYEPCWAIGTGKAATPQHAQAILAFLRGHISLLDAQVGEDIRLLYGGSVKAMNAESLFKMPDIDGGLIGGASLIADEFIEICEIANSVTHNKIAA